jgi:hypothetical protein
MLMLDLLVRSVVPTLRELLLVASHARIACVASLVAIRILRVVHWLVELLSLCFKLLIWSLLWCSDRCSLVQNRGLIVSKHFNWTFNKWSQLCICDIIQPSETIHYVWETYDIEWLVVLLGSLVRTSITVIALLRFVMIKKRKVVEKRLLMAFLKTSRYYTDILVSFRQEVLNQILENTLMVSTDV